MTNIKLYKPKLVVELKDGTKLYSDRKLEDLLSYLNKDKINFIQIGDTLVNKYEVKKAYIEKINGVEDYILSLPKDIQQKVREREKQMKEKVGKSFTSIKQIKKYLQYK